MQHFEFYLIYIPNITCHFEQVLFLVFHVTTALISLNKSVHISGYFI